MTDPVSIIAFCLALIVAVLLIVLFKKRIIDDGDITGTGEILQAIPVPEGSGAFGLIVQYAKIAVSAVEQLVHNGIIKPDNASRKNAAMNMVAAAAKIDGVPYGAEEMEVADYCVEAEVQQLPRNQKPPDTAEE